MKQILKKHWLLILLGVLLFGVAVPLVINVLFKFNSSIKIFQAEWKAGDALNFYGVFLASLGTVFLGAVAFFQNRQANKLNADMQKMQQAQFVSMVSIEKLEVNTRNAKYPNYINMDFKEPEVFNLTLQNYTTIDCFHIDISLYNISDFPIVEISVFSEQSGDFNAALYGIAPIVEKPIYIDKKASKNIRIIIPTKAFKAPNQKSITLNLWYGNIFDYRTKASIYIEDLTHEGHKADYKYRLNKFTDVKPKEAN